MKPPEVIRAELIETLATARAYKSSDAYAAIVKLLDAIDEVHRESLLTASIDGVARIQGAAAQVRQLRNALVSDSIHASPVL
jgi:hypothetical protein